MITTRRTVCRRAPSPAVRAVCVLSRNYDFSGLPALERKCRLYPPCACAGHPPPVPFRFPLLPFLWLFLEPWLVRKVVIVQLLECPF